MNSRYKKGDCIYANGETDIHVYEAVDLRTNEPVAIKEVVTYDSETANKLLRESWIQASLSHPNICKLYGQYFYKDGERFTCGLATELLPSNLQLEINAYCKRTERIPETTLWVYLEQLISALALAQEKCISHRDIKPQNLLTGPKNVIKVGDLGAAKMHIRVSTLQTLAGTPDYLSPKIRKQSLENAGNGISAKVMHNPYKSDVFSLGVTFICAALWEVPSELMTLEHLQEKLDRTIQQLPYSQRFREFLTRMVIVDEETRPDFLALRRSSLLAAQPAAPVFNEMGHLLPGHCIYCKVYLAEKTSAPIPLRCNSLHAFCSPSCFRSFISRETKAYSLSLSLVKCPLCSFPLDESAVSPVYGNDYPPLPSGLERCSYCKSAVQPLDICRCEHRFCLNCLQTLKKVHGRIPKRCPEDDIPFDRENIKKHRAFCKIF